MKQSEKQSEVLKQQELTLLQKKRELEELTTHKAEQIKQAESSVLSFRQKYEQCLGHIDELRTTLELLQKQLLDVRQRDLEKQEQLENLRLELETSALQYEELKKANLKFERISTELTRELQVRYFFKLFCKLSANLHSE